MASPWTMRLLNAGNEGTLALALALGHELGIFDLIGSSTHPMTSAEIAEKGKLKERYVREWLGCMVAGEVIQVTRDNPLRYSIREEHKPELGDISIGARLFASYAVRYDAVKDCFRQDGPSGVSHTQFPGVFNVFHAMRTSTSASTVDKMVALVDGLSELLQQGIKVAEFGCGTGVLILELAGRYPNSRFHGSDISADGLAIAREKLAESGLSNVTFSLADLHSLPSDMHGKFDWAFTFDVIHDLPHPLKALNEIDKALKAGGWYVMGDVHTPEDRCAIAGDDGSMSLYGISTFLCLPASAAPDGALGRGAAWSVPEAQELIAQSNLALQETVSDQPYFAFYVCRKLSRTSLAEEHEAKFRGYLASLTASRKSILYGL